METACIALSGVLLPTTEPQAPTSTMADGRYSSDLTWWRYEAKATLPILLLLYTHFFRGVDCSFLLMGLDLIVSRKTLIHEWSGKSFFSDWSIAPGVSRQPDDSMMISKSWLFRLVWQRSKSPLSLSFIFSFQISTSLECNPTAYSLIDISFSHTKWKMV